MFGKVLVPMDGSAVAEGILPFVESLGKKPGVQVTLLHVVDPETLERNDPQHAPFINQMVARTEVRARDYLHQLEDKYRSSICSLDSKVLVGPAAQKIAEHAEQNGYDLIAMSTHGRSGVTRWVFGSVADRVLHTTHIPLVLARPEETATGLQALVHPLQRVLTPLDGSETAEQALPFAVELAKKLDVELHVITVLQHQMGSGFGFYVEDPTGALQRSTEEYLTGVKQKLSGQGVKTKFSLLWGYPAGRILDAAHAEPGTIIALTTHGRSGIARIVLGSVADKVVRGAGVPVLVIRPEVTE